MNTHGGAQVVVAAGLLYLALLGWSVANISYDIWGAMILVPVWGTVGVLMMRRMFRGSQRTIATVMCWGLLIKLAGVFARYGVSFEAYDGATDAQRYHNFGVESAGRVWSGEQSVFDVVPSGTGTEFLEHFTAFVYTLTGSSLLGGFITFAFIGYLGLAFFVKAAAVAVPGMALRKYAWFMVAFPSVVYWPSSIGKDALVMAGLGVGAYGVALMLARRSWVTSIVLVAGGLGFAGIIRPHMAGIWLAAAFPALILALLLGGRSKSIVGQWRASNRFSVILVIALSAVAISAVSSITVRFLDPTTEEVGAASITDILAETQRRSAKNGSTFVPPLIDSPASWPFAAARTLTRPLPIEVSGAAQLASAAELVALGGIYLMSWRRLRNLPKLLLTNPYVVFSMTALFLGGLAYSSFANLGILTRQKSLLFPFLLLVPCLPMWARRRPKERLGSGARTAQRGTSAPARGKAPSVRPATTASGTFSEQDFIDVWG
ncbi:MAG: hypothetical protein ACJAR2_000035 [Ilumatobacter sp.]|jgi:hypothetical protein